MKAKSKLRVKLLEYIKSGELIQSGQLYALIDYSPEEIHDVLAELEEENKVHHIYIKTYGWTRK